MSEPTINFQTWICPRCCNDHHFSVACKGTVVEMFMPSEKDHSYIANEYRKRVSEIDKLNKQNKIMHEALMDIQATPLCHLDPDAFELATEALKQAEEV